MMTPTWNRLLASIMPCLDSGYRDESVFQVYCSVVVPDPGADHEHGPSAI